jgi:hypothetical protein
MTFSTMLRAAARRYLSELGSDVISAMPLIASNRVPPITARAIQARAAGALRQVNREIGWFHCGGGSRLRSRSEFIEMLNPIRTSSCERQMSGYEVIGFRNLGMGRDPEESQIQVNGRTPVQFSGRKRIGSIVVHYTAKWPVVPSNQATIDRIDGDFFDPLPVIERETYNNRFDSPDPLVRELYIQGIPELNQRLQLPRHNESKREYVIRLVSAVEGCEEDQIPDEYLD